MSMAVKVWLNVLAVIALLRVATTASPVLPSSLLPYELIRA
jgi:hypothetical protein